jgi:hypothetical protein
MISAMQDILVPGVGIIYDIISEQVPSYDAVLSSFGLLVHYI